MNVIPLEKRHCGRCQCEFDGDPDLFFQTDWALCHPSADILLPVVAHYPARLGLNHVGIGAGLRRLSKPQMPMTRRTWGEGDRIVNDRDC